ncbi:Lrp/AsnC family transcriptional regulator [Deinococcus hopiensis]|nr:Lrp/AsnC family transcriptional regulator [Deinococcus hopiensis]
MQDDMKSRPHRVENRLQAELLMDRTWLRLLDVFAREGRGVADAARVLGVTTEWLFRRVRRLERAGLLSVQGARSRAGRAVKLYRAAAETFFVPFSLVPPETVGRQNRAQHLELFETAIGRTFLQAPFDQDGWGFVTARMPNGDVHLRIMREDGALWADLGDAAPVMVSGWHVLHLTPSDAHELQGELRALHGRYAQRTGEVPFLLGIFLADTSRVSGLEHAHGAAP